MRQCRFKTTARGNNGFRRAVYGGLWLLISMGTAAAAGAGSAATGQASSAPMSIQVNDDRLTIAVARAPQVYLYGAIDAGAPQRFEALVRSRKIPPGSDIYLNFAHGDMAAGLALGELFRAGSMATHLGTPRRKKGRAGYKGPKAAVCTGACVYAYLGGLYRWAPTGGDRVGVIPYRATAATPSLPTVAEVDAYLKRMGIDPADLPASSPATPSTDSPLWLTADRMREAGLANGGRLPMTAKTGLLPTPFLELHQDDRHGSHRLVLQCHPGNITLTAYDVVGTTRAKQIVAHSTRSYFEVNRQEVLTLQRDGVSAVGDELVITRPYPPSDLARLLSAQSIGGWAGGRSDAFRYGFTFWLYPARHAISEFYNACWRAAPWPERVSVKKD